MAHPAFDLDPAVAHLNHGAFGTVPRVVRESQQRWARRAEANPHRFNRVELPGLVAQARAVVADFLDVGADEVALVRNVTEAVSTVLASLGLRDGDEVVVSNHRYGAVALALQAWSARYGTVVREARVELAAGQDEVVAAFESVMGERTRLVLVDQITSPTARLFPVAQVCRAARRRGAVSFVDAAHVPGQLADLDLPGLGADFWVGNLHKWAFGVRGCGALWVAPSQRDRLHPLVVGWQHGLPFPETFDLHGTDDYSGWLSLPDALSSWRELGGCDISVAGGSLAEQGQRLVATEIGTDDQLAKLPTDPAPAMRLVPLPTGMADDEAGADRLYQTLSDEFAVEAAVLSWDDRGWVRLGAQVYNSLDDFARLATALRVVGGRSGRG